MLKKFFINLKLKKGLQVSLPKGKNNAKVLFLVNADQFDAASIHTSFQATFENKYTVEKLCFTQQRKKIKEQAELYFGTKDFSFIGNISTEKLKDVIHQDYEYVFQFFSKEHLYLNYLSAKTKANLRIGFEDVNPKLTDLLFKLNKTDLDLFFEEAKKYLEIIKKSA